MEGMGVGWQKERILPIRWVELEQGISECRPGANDADSEGPPPNPDSDTAESADDDLNARPSNLVSGRQRKKNEAGVVVNRLPFPPSSPEPPRLLPDPRPRHVVVPRPSNLA